MSLIKGSILILRKRWLLLKSNQYERQSVCGQLSQMVANRLIQADHTDKGLELTMPPQPLVAGRMIGSSSALA